MRVVLALSLAMLALSWPAAAQPEDPFGPACAAVQAQYPDLPLACPYPDKGACPFEGCHYASWRALAPTDLLASIGGDRIVASLDTGDTVEAVDGVVYVVPCPSRVRYPIPGFDVGATVFRLSYRGENSYDYWRNGAVEWGWIEDCAGDAGPSEACWVEPIVDCAYQDDWWVRMRTSTGAVGWTRPAQNFSGTDRFE